MGISNKDGIVRDPPSFTKGSILFGGVGGAIEEDNANLFWDNVNKRLGIRTTSPRGLLDLKQGTGVGVPWRSGLNIYDGDNCLGIIEDATIANFRNYATGGYRFHNSFGSTIVQFTNDGKVGIGTMDPTEKLHVVGNIRADGNIIPDADNLRNIGSDTLRWALVRAVSVITGSLNLKSEKGDWTLEEGEDGIYAFNNKTGKKYKVRLDEVN
ncbi:MAG: hypothetical protein QW618_03210 [Nitrososphaerales archaeon]